MEWGGRREWGWRDKVGGREEQPSFILAAGLYMGFGEGECLVECAKLIGRKVNLVRGGFCEKAF